MDCITSVNLIKNVAYTDEAHSYYKKVQEEIRALLSSIDAKENDVKSHRSELSTSKQECTDCINNIANEAVRRIKDLKEVSIAELNKVYENCLEAMTSKLDDFSEQKQELYYFKTLFENLINESTKEAFIQMKMQKDILKTYTVKSKSSSETMKRKIRFIADNVWIHEICSKEKLGECSITEGLDDDQRENEHPKKIDQNKQLSDRTGSQTSDRTTIIKENDRVYHDQYKSLNAETDEKGDIDTDLPSDAGSEINDGQTWASLSSDTEVEDTVEQGITSVTSDISSSTIKLQLQEEHIVSTKTEKDIHIDQQSSIENVMESSVALTDRFVSQTVVAKSTTETKDEPRMFRVFCSPVDTSAKTIAEQSYSKEHRSTLTRSCIDEVEEEPLTKIVVSNLPDNVTADYLEMFFENPRKSGGGEIVDIEMYDEDAMAIIEFKVPEAVQNVLKKQPIKMLNVKIDIKVYEPEIIRDIAEDLLGGYGDPYRLLVTDLPEKADTEYLEMFFENRKRFDGVVVTGITMYEDYCAALVEFNSTKDVQTVLSKQPIEVYKTKLGVYPYNPSKLPHDIIEVHGPAIVMEMFLLEMYFESTNKSGGDDIVDMRLEENEQGGVAFIQFETEEVAARVIAKGTHSISKNKLFVKLYEPSDPCMEFLKQNSGITDEGNSEKTGKDGAAKAINKNNEPEQTTTNIVKVIGVNKFKSMDTVQFYFENTRRSGGGPIKDLKHDKHDNNIIFIHFESIKDAENVVEIGYHKVEGCDMTTFLYFQPAPLPVYPNKILVKGLKCTTGKDCLFNYLESKSGGCIPEQEQRAEHSAMRLVTFKEEIDFDRLQNNLKPLEGATLTIEKVTVSNCIYVSNYDESFGKDTLEFYFENAKRSGGGQIDKVIFNEDKGFWLIFFNDYNVIDRVLAKDHTLHGQKLVVKSFIECLELPEGGEAQPKFRCPTHIIISDVVTVKETITNLNTLHTKMLLALKYPSKMEEKYKYLKMKINLNRNEMIFEGVSNAVQKAKLDMYELTHAFATRECQVWQPGSLKLYQDKQVKDYITKYLKRQNVSAVWEEVGNKLIVCTPCEEQLELGLEFIRDSVKFINL